MDKKSMQKDSAGCCSNLLKGCANKAWVEYVKPNLANYVVGLIIVLVSGVLGGASMATTALIAVTASIFAIHNFHTQQRAARIQKIYYEGSLLSVLKHLNDSIGISTKNYSHFITAINFINNDIKNMKKGSESTIKMLDNLLLQVKNSSVYLSSEREIFITLFKEKGYKIYQWLFKFDKDIMNFNSFCLEMLAEYRTTPPPNKLAIDTQLKELLNDFYLIQRHMCLAYLIEKIIPIIGEGDFKSDKVTFIL